LPLVCSLLTGFVLFSIARRAFNENAAVLSAVIYWSLPLEVTNSVIVQTQPLNTLMVCCSVLLIIRCLHGGSTVGWWSSGVLAAVGYYVRQSALVVPFLVLVVFISFFIWRKENMLREIMAFFCGYASVVLLVLLFYSKFFTWRDLLEHNLTPIGFLAKTALKLIIGSVEAPMGSVYVLPHEYVDGGMQLYINYAKSAIFLHLFLFVGIGASIFQLGWKFIQGERFPANRVADTVILYLWFFGMVLAYIYYFQTRGFYIDYIREIIPPLVILFAGWAVTVFGRKNSGCSWNKLLCITLLVVVSGFFLGSAYPNFPKTLQLIIVCLLVFTACLFVGSLTFGAKARMTLWSGLLIAIGIGLCYLRLSKTVLSSVLAALLTVAYASSYRVVRYLCKIDAEAWWRAVGLSIIAGSISVSISYSVAILDRRYDAIWSRESLREVADLISSQSGEHEQVMSGGVVWEFEAGRKPFLMISHPLMYRDRMKSRDRELVGKALREAPPKVIVQDGYTEKNYFKYFPWMGDFLEQRYRQIHTAGPARYPVIVYFRTDG
jgi:hypothetical protein